MITKKFKKLLNRWVKDDDKIILDFLEETSEKIKIARYYKKGIMKDYEQIILYYLNHGVSIDEILNRLNLEKLNSFYQYKRINDWYPLDHAAKSYPLAMSAKWMSIFRVSMYLNERVIPKVLQMALNFTIKRFPYFATAVRYGFFWHYIDGIKRRFKVEKEESVPCGYMDVAHGIHASFRVLYYKNRISVEFFHILTDGSGALIFLETLAGEYLRLMGKEITREVGFFDIHEEAQETEFENYFPKTDKSSGKASFVEKPSLQIEGTRTLVQPSQIINFEMNFNELKTKCKEHGATVSVMILTMMFFAVKATIKKQKIKDDSTIQIQVPVNMRKYYPTRTLKNFSMVAGIRIKYHDINNFDEVLKEVDNQLKIRNTKEELDKIMTKTNLLIDRLKYVPLFLKSLVMPFIYPNVEKSYATCFSNLGVIKVRKSMESYVDKYDCVLGTLVLNNAAVSMNTYKDKSILSINKAIKENTFEETILKHLIDLGVNVDIYGSKER